MVIIQYISDIHLEFYKDKFECKLEVSAPILCLLGDIGYPSRINYAKFLEWCSKNYKKVFLIAGNHEYYDTVDNIKLGENKISRINNEIEKQVERFENISFLNNKTEEYEGYIFTGCTLWSNIPDKIRNYELRRVNDFKKINITKEEYNTNHQNDLKFLENAIETNLNSNMILITHHLPYFELIHEKYGNFEQNYIFATELKYLIRKDKIKVWLCGHSHMPNTKNINEVICSLNPFGYPDEYKSDDCLRCIYEV